MFVINRNDLYICINTRANFCMYRISFFGFHAAVLNNPDPARNHISIKFAINRNYKIYNQGYNRKTMRFCKQIEADLRIRRSGAICRPDTIPHTKICEIFILSFINELFILCMIQSTIT